MKANFWALILSLFLAGTADSQQSASPKGTNSLATNTPAKIAEVRAKAEKGDAAAQGMLGSMYIFGQGVDKDQTEAVKWLLKASEQGDPDAQYNLGVCYELGEGVSQDYPEAMKWLREAAEQGRADAQYKLGLFYAVGRPGVPKNAAEAKRWSLKAADHYRRAAEHGDLEAQTLLAACYSNMDDNAEAVKWSRRAAAQGDAVEQFNLGMAYSHGNGVPKSDIEAYKWFSLAAAQGFEQGAEGRDSLAKTMSRAEIVEGQRLSSEFVVHKEGGASNRPDGEDSATTGNLPRFTGTGFFVTDDGYLLTCCHVVQDAARIAVRTKAGTFAATLVKADKANDVALLKVAGKFPALPVGSSRGVKLGESVFTIGFPNIELQGFAPKLTKGDISSLTGVQDDPREFQISVAVQPGNSGGPLVNLGGNVVGIVAAQLADIVTLETTGSLPQNVNYAVKSSVLNVLLESLPEISPKLPQANSIKDRKFEDVEKEAEGAVALVLVY